MKRLYLTLILVIAALGLAGFVFWQYFYLSTVNINPVPSDATIKVNGTPTADRTIRLKSGTYQIEVSAPGYRKEDLTVKTGVGSQVTKRIELASLPRPQKLVEGKIDSLTASDDRKTFYFNNNGTLYLYSPPSGADNQPQSTPPVPITPAIENIDTINWSPDFNLALLRKKDGEIGLYDFHRYDLLHQEYRVLDPSWKTVAWLPDASGFYAENKTDTGEHSIIKLSRAGTNPSQMISLAGLPLEDIVFTTGPANFLILSSNNTKKATDIFAFDSFQRLILPITDSGRATAPILSPDRSKLAYLDSGELVVADITGQNKRNLTIRPRSGNYRFVNNTTLAAVTANQVSLISIADGTTKTYDVYAPSEIISNLIVDPDGKVLYYTYQDSLYQLKFKE